MSIIGDNQKTVSLLNDLSINTKRFNNQPSTTNIIVNIVDEKFNVNRFSNQLEKLDINKILSECDNNFEKN